MSGRDDLERAFWLYEFGLSANAVDVLDASFENAGTTIRSDGGTTLVGHEAIAAFRATRPPIPPRRVERLHRTDLDDRTAVLVVEAVKADGSTTINTQVWRRGVDDEWRIAVAHVSGGPAPAAPTAPAAALPSIWRVAPGAAELPGPSRSGRLDGLGIAVKDLYAVAGQRIGGGNPHVLAEEPVQTESAVAVERLLAAGAYVAGIAHTDELAYSIAGTNVHYGTPYNAAAPGRITGGSSSGSAAAVAGGQADIGLGTDTAGSIRVPVSYCGLYGMRPTHGAISLERVLPLAQSFDTAGVMARDPSTLSTAMSHLLEPPSGDGSSYGRLMVSPLLRSLAEPATRLAFDAALRAMDAEPVEVLSDDVDLAELDRWRAAFSTVQAAEGWRNHGARIERYAGTFQPEIEARFRFGATVTPQVEAGARALLATVSTRVHALLADETVLALPATSGPAPRADAPAAAFEQARTANLRLTFLASATGCPVLVQPTLRVGSLPVGLALMGAPGTDHRLLHVLLPREPRKPDWVLRG